MSIATRAMPYNLRRLMTTPVELKRSTGKNRYNEQTFAPAPYEAYTAHIEDKNRIVRNVAGEEVLSSTRVYLSESIAVNPDDRLIIAGVERRIASVDRDTTRFGWSTTVLNLI